MTAPDQVPAPARPGHRRWVLAGLLTLIVAAYFVEVRLGEGSLSRAHFISSTFALSLTGLKQGQLWQLVTYQFMHGGPLHLALNCLGLLLLGWNIEAILGRGRMLAYFLLGGVGAALVQTAVWAAKIEGSTVMVGASGSIMALMGVICRCDWSHKMRLWLLFIIPATMTGRTTLIFLTAVEVAGMFIERSPFAHWAHLGGLYTGLFLAAAFGPLNFPDPPPPANPAPQSSVANGPGCS